MIRKRGAPVEMWAKAIGRKCEHGSEWKPDKNHRICGLHFYSGKYSNDPQDPDYVPSWFQNKGTIQGVEQLNVILPEKTFLDLEGKIENQNICVGNLFFGVKWYLGEKFSKAAYLCNFK
jgi:hypothetical protein